MTLQNAPDVPGHQGSKHKDPRWRTDAQDQVSTLQRQKDLHGHASYIPQRLRVLSKHPQTLPNRDCRAGSGPASGAWGSGVLMHPGPAQESLGLKSFLKPPDAQLTLCQGSRHGIRPFPCDSPGSHSCSQTRYSQGQLSLSKLPWFVRHTEWLPYVGAQARTSEPRLNACTSTARPSAHREQHRQSAVHAPQCLRGHRAKVRPALHRLPPSWHPCSVPTNNSPHSSQRVSSHVVRSYHSPLKPSAASRVKRTAP